mmetsp:Transcript_37711/g.87092  ORF Transcript_37711/g.87092 Transcript_37711/m.87092 type:complete len:307 (-) Transcript_37711:157-1077(-)
MPGMAAAPRALWFLALALSAWRSAQSSMASLSASEMPSTSSVSHNAKGGGSGNSTVSAICSQSSMSNASISSAVDMQAEDEEVSLPLSISSSLWGFSACTTTPPTCASRSGSFDLRVMKVSIARLCSPDISSTITVRRRSTLSNFSIACNLFSKRIILQPLPVAFASLLCDSFLFSVFSRCCCCWWLAESGGCDLDAHPASACGLALALAFCSALRPFPFARDGVFEAAACFSASSEHSALPFPFPFFPLPCMPASCLVFVPASARASLSFDLSLASYSLRPSGSAKHSNAAITCWHSSTVPPLSG